MKFCLLFLLLLIPFFGIAQTPQLDPKNGSRFSMGGHKGWHEPDSGFIAPSRNAKKSAAGIQYNKPGRFWYDRYSEMDVDSSFYGWDGNNEVRFFTTKDSNEIKDLAASGSDDQQLSISNDTIFLENGGYVVLPTGSSGFDSVHIYAALKDTAAVLRDSLRNHWTEIMGKQASLGFTPVTNARTLTINGTTYDLIANRTWTIAVPYYADSLLRAFDSIAAHNTRLLAWEHSAAFGIAVNDIADWDNAYSNRIQSLTNTGSSGLATLINNVLNIPDYSAGLSGYVPYSGASGNLDMGAHRITATRVNTDTIEAVTSAGIHIHNTSHEDIIIIGAGGGKTAALYGGISLDGNKIQNSTDTVLTTDGNGTIGKAALSSVYLKISTSVNAIPLVSGSNNTVTVPIATGVTGLGSGIATWLATPSSSNFFAAITDETGSGAIVGATAPTLTNPIVGTQTTGDNSTKAASTAYVDNFYKDTTTTSFTTSMTPIVPLANKLYTVQYNITAQSGALLINNPNITMANGQLIIFAIHDNGTPVALTYGTNYRAGTDISSLPTTTAANKFLYLEFMRNATDGKLDLIGKANGY